MVIARTKIQHDTNKGRIENCPTKRQNHFSLSITHTKECILYNVYLVLKYRDKIHD